MKVFTRFLMIFGLTALLSHPRAFAGEFVAIGGLYYDLNDEEQTADVVTWGIVDYDKPLEKRDIVIPSAVVYSGKTYHVTCISEEAFAYCDILTSVTIPNSVTSIGRRAFDYSN